MNFNVGSKTDNKVENSDVLIHSDLKGKFWLISADLGYGHQRAIYPARGGRLKWLSESTQIWYI